jgi:LEA14-like dessication related protein
MSLSRDRTVETDIVGQFDSTETRPVEADQPFVSDPVLYINETRGSWDRGNVTRTETPMDLSFDVYNPKPYPYTVSRIGYDVRMNGLSVGDGETQRGVVIAPGETETVRVDSTIRNQLLDQWWVSHLQRNQVTDLYIDFYLVVEAAGERFRIDLDAIDYETTIETDIFDNKAQYPTGTNESAGESTDGGSDGESTPSDGESTTSDGESTPSDDETPTEESTATDGGNTGTTTETAADSTPTETDDGILDDPL